MASNGSSAQRGIGARSEDKACSRAFPLLAPRTCCAQSRKSWRSRSVTPGKSPASCSTSRGTAMSTMRSGRSPLADRAADNADFVTMTSPEPVDVKRTSASRKTSLRSVKSRTVAPTVWASSSARSLLRFNTTTFAEAFDDKARATPVPISPAPMTTMFLPSREPRMSVAISTAACETDAVPRLIAVSVRTRLPTSRARSMRHWRWPTWWWSW